LMKLWTCGSCSKRSVWGLAWRTNACVQATMSLLAGCVVIAREPPRRHPSRLARCTRLRNDGKGAVRKAEELTSAPVAERQAEFERLLAECAGGALRQFGNLGDRRLGTRMGAQLAHIGRTP